MKSKWNLLLIGSLFLSVITACSEMPNTAQYSPKADVIIVVSKGKGCHLCLVHQKINLGTYAVIQSAAEATLRSGHKRFAIERPDFLKQATINTAEEYLERCSIHAGDLLANNRDPCKLRNRYKKPQMTIKVYNDAPLERLTFDAESVLDILKAKDLYEQEHSLGQYTVKP